MPVEFKALIETIVIEYIIILIFIRSKPLYLFGITVLINCFTQPAAFFVYNYLIDSPLNQPSILYFLFIEICVVIAELFLIKLLLKLSFGKSLIISFTANFVTAALSFFV
jgi:hypothetical protein